MDGGEPAGSRDACRVPRSVGKAGGGRCGDLQMKLGHDDDDD